MPYLTADQVRSTVAQIAALSGPESRLVVNYQAKSFPTTVLRVAMRLVLRLSRQADPMAGEPWRSLWPPQRVRRMLSDNDFEVSSDLSLLALAEGLGLPAGASGSLRNGRVAVAVRR